MNLTKHVQDYMVQNFKHRDEGIYLRMMYENQEEQEEEGKK